ncbi:MULTISPECIES: type 1 glutamine amidotransferase [Paenibacillus]|uniref:type 1 glutamine amidotransferase n=1 Tax=Paenibacillus TaxID=44249 RepID=UPI0006D16E92|nr:MULTISPECIES: type 1 glutamine amidotransferase [Paenibacillus]GCL71622.1 type 1 glutamine amidotransferase [Paenibacillus naphthalenovorans]
MRLLLMKHFSFDDESCFVTWASTHHGYVETFVPSEGRRFPDVSSFDLLVILGGPMSAYHEQRHPWISAEKAFIRKAVHLKKMVLGICLGAQLLAEVLGGKVYKNEQKEIGWHPVFRTGQSHFLMKDLPDRFYSFQWHGDTFELSSELLHLAYSEACQNQAFAYGDRVLGLQFHLESTPKCIETMVSEWSSELIDAQYIQNKEQISLQTYRHKDSEAMLHSILDNFHKLYLLEMPVSTTL